MAYVKTDATYYGPKATSIDLEVNLAPYNPKNVKSIRFELKKPGGTIVHRETNSYSKVTGTFHASIAITRFLVNPKLKGTYYVKVTFFNSSGKVITSVESKKIYFT
ncbi:hypothetical protein NSQ26_05965 [Bacillus sp. FSL W7-1360]